MGPMEFNRFNRIQFFEFHVIEWNVMGYLLGDMSNTPTFDGLEPHSLWSLTGR